MKKAIFLVMIFLLAYTTGCARQVDETSRVADAIDDVTQPDDVQLTGDALSEADELSSLEDPDMEGELDSIDLSDW